MKSINLYFDFEFTSLSPDAQPISLGIMSDESPVIGEKLPISIFTKDKIEFHFKHFIPEYVFYMGTSSFGTSKFEFDVLPEFKKYYSECNRAAFMASDSSFINHKSKSFYAEFSDFQIERCDNWVKENVVSKLKYYGTPQQDKMFLDSSVDEGIYWGSQNTDEIKGALHKWLEQFSDYQIQFVVDCGTWDWYWMVQLLAEWDKKKELVFNETEHYLQPEHLRHKEELELFVKAKGREIIRVVDMLPKVNMDIKPNIISASVQDNSAYYIITKTGLPKLPDNISPVPFDLNDLIAIKYKLTPMEAFNVNRETLLYLIDTDKQYSEMYEVIDNTYKLRTSKHNALWDAKVIKAIYNILI